MQEEIDLALFSAGGKVSKTWAPKLAEKGVKVIDNSSYWRMCSKHKLIVPEINGGQLKGRQNNCKSQLLNNSTGNGACPSSQ